MKEKKGLGIHSFLTELLLVCIAPVVFFAVVFNLTADSNLKSGLQNEATNTLEAVAVAVK